MIKNSYKSDRVNYVFQNEILCHPNLENPGISNHASGMIKNSHKSDRVNYVFQNEIVYHPNLENQASGSSNHACPQLSYVLPKLVYNKFMNSYKYSSVVSNIQAWYIVCIYH